jgi:hypothetical protein
MLTCVKARVKLPKSRKLKFHDIKYLMFRKFIAQVSIKICHICLFDMCPSSGGASLKCSGGTQWSLIFFMGRYKNA